MLNTHHLKFQETIGFSEKPRLHQWCCSRRNLKKLEKAQQDLTLSDVLGHVPK